MNVNFIMLSKMHLSHVKCSVSKSAMLPIILLPYFKENKKSMKFSDKNKEKKSYHGR